jgi:hypothetical protein
VWETAFTRDQDVSTRGETARVGKAIGHLRNPLAGMERILRREVIRKASQ